ncbi:GPW/gp25 family protein [Nostoc sp.]|uniref:GPW/gp25 family protein n=1 Tax=Nostoc sp. TaxID=1180 RepID=UPI002FEE7A34
MNRHDYAFPFRIDAVSGQAAQTSYEAHVEQMIRQVLLTAPGERVDLPEFGCGLRQLIFAPHSDALDTTTKLIVTQALNRWLAGQIQVQSVTVVSPTTTSAQGQLLDQSQLVIEIDYVLIETLSNKSLQVQVI